MRLKTLNQKMEYLRNGVRYCLLLILLVLAFATGAHAAQDDYYYPNYDASANGCVDLMNYVKRVTVTVNGVDYTLNQLDQMQPAGNPADHAGWRYHLLQRAVRFAGPRL